ncbi:MAG TPA: hypothetical protein VMN04_07920 [Thermoanaerobaculia bacterium]|nr:hypothetical protein [Thermoanaerobaculia bacterium]
MGLPRRNALRLASAAVLAAVVGAFPAAGQTPGACAPNAPVLTGPSSVNAGETYAVSWTNVLGSQTAAPIASNAYVVQRALDPSFTNASTIDTVTTQRSALTFSAAPAGATALYHRVMVRTPCATLAAIYSNVLAVSVKTICDVPPSVGQLTSSPENPPAFSTWVISWDTLGSGAGPGGGYTNLKFRIRRTSALEPDGVEWVVDAGSASFTGPPGVYVFEVRAEAACGAVGPWSPPKTVTVGSVVKPSLVLISEPAPLAQVAPAAAGARPATSFAVRNGGTAPLTAYTKCDDTGFVIAPAQFTLAPGARQDVSVTSLYGTVLPKPVTTSVAITYGGTTLNVPILLMLAASPAAAPVTWSAPAADVDVNGTAVTRSLVNPGATVAPFVGSVKAPWIAVQSLDGQPWDRPMAPFEVRPVRLVIDRAKRRAETGTEVGAVALTTVGFDAPETLVVTDDGPRILPAATGSAALPAASAKTRVLYASFPNALDAKGVGRFAADLWLTNTDVVNPITLSLFFNPVGGPGDGSALRRFDIELAAGETRRYRNIVSTLLGVDGAFAVEVRSSAPTVSATALVSNTAVPAVAAQRRALTGAAPGSYGFEMRPTSPGEGAKQSDPIQVVSGLAHDANRRSNLLLLETSGYDTTVLVQLYDKAGSQVTKNGQPVQLEKTIPANGALQINDADELFDAAPLAGSYAYALITWKSSATDANGAPNGSVVGMATVIDNRTQDSSLHVGVSTSALDPSYVPSSSLNAGRTALASLPYGGYPAPLVFPAVHSSGAPLASGEKPFWRTRVTLTNTSDKAADQRTMTLSYSEPNASAVTGQVTVVLSPRAVASFEDLLEAPGMDVLPGQNSYGSVMITATKNNDGTWATGWAGVDVQTETYTVDPAQGVGDYKTGMEGYAYFHGYSSFQSNLGTMSFDGAENSTNYRTNLILNEVGGASCDVVIAAYMPGSFVPVASVTKRLPPNGYFSDELFTNILGLNLTDVTDVRIVVRQVAGDGVFLAFASKIDRASGDPANIFLRPAAAGTGR